PRLRAPGDAELALAGWRLAGIAHRIDRRVRRGRTMTQHDYVSAGSQHLEEVTRRWWLAHDRGHRKRHKRGHRKRRKQDTQQEQSKSRHPFALYFIRACRAE